MTKTPEGAAEELRLACVEATERLVDALEVRGLRPCPGALRTWRGTVTIDRGASSPAEAVVDIHIPRDYPFVQPKVRPRTREAAEAWLGRQMRNYYEPSWLWHRERDGAMCLFEQAEHSSLPWAEPGPLFDQIEAWFREDAAGWPHDAPQLDIERYLKRTGLLLIVGDLRAATGKVVALVQSRSHPALRLGRPVKVPRGTRGSRAQWPRSAALVLDIGELGQPIRNWATLIAAAGEQASRLEREVGNGVRELVLAYTRGGEHGVLGLRLARTEGGWDVMAHDVALADTATITRRAHPAHRELSTKRVTIVGLGAVGSVLADLLHRSGVGHLHLMDPDLLTPGNAVRHLCGTAYAGQPKVNAVAATLRQARPESATTIDCTNGRLDSLERALAVLAECDLVVDATADSTASQLLAAAARAGAGLAVSVCVLADGYAVRADHWPEPLSGGLPAPVLPPLAPGVYETGCSSPVSTTPPAAAWEAAALGARHAVHALLDPDAIRPEERVLQPSGPP